MVNEAAPEPTDELEHVAWLDRESRLSCPTLIAAFEGWNDAGDAATTAAAHLADSWECETLASIDPEPFFDFTATRPIVRLDDSKARSIDWPTNELRAARLGEAGSGRRDALLLIGTEPQLRWRTFTRQVVSVAELLGVEQVITLGALLAEVPHSRDVEVYGSTEDQELQETLGLTPSRYEGPTGIVGVLSAACRDAGFSTASFWSAVPSYMPAAPSPKAALALIDRVCAVMKTPVPTLELQQRAKLYEQEITRIVAEDDDTAEYVARLERAWDNREHEDDAAGGGADLIDNPGLLVAEVEKFLRDGS
ncbi:MAG: PAC2 family protein [Acidimicrobiaceae bacterium]|nr:PAC2 family protein [Acidimicrobiaceae bacterium]